MDPFVHACKQIDAELDTIMGAHCQSEPVPVTLIRAAAKLIVSTYPAHRERALALGKLMGSAGHLKAMEGMDGGRHG